MAIQQAISLAIWRQFNWLFRWLYNGSSTGYSTGNMMAIQQVIPLAI